MEFLRSTQSYGSAPGPCHISLESQVASSCPLAKQKVDLFTADSNSNSDSEFRTLPTKKPSHDTASSVLHELETPRRVRPVSSSKKESVVDFCQRALLRP
ncbi:hypothetical protein Pelo_4312 [Pelomyxa schiedti]|nr:hypothetical protein Pelo_4312 [Pelomyxa schiedti]